MNNKSKGKIKEVLADRILGPGVNNQHRHIGFKLITVIIFILALTAIIIISILRDRIVNNYNNQVSVTGRGEVSYQPDVANVNLGVQINKSAKAEEALTALNDKVTKIETALTALGIEAKDIKTQTYSLYPYYDYINGVSTLGGYNANQQIIIKVNNVDKDISLLNKVVSESTKAGANQIDGITFESSNLENLKQEARILAINDAKSKAVDLSSNIGVSLGDIVGWWENVVSPTIDYSYSSYSDGMGGSGESNDSNISVGNYEVVIELNLSYKIKK